MICGAEPRDSQIGTKLTPDLKPMTVLFKFAAADASSSAVPPDKRSLDDSKLGASFMRADPENSDYLRSESAGKAAEIQGVLGGSTSLGNAISNGSYIVTHIKAIECAPFSGSKQLKSFAWQQQVSEFLVPISKSRLQTPGSATNGSNESRTSSRKPISAVSDKTPHKSGIALKLSGYSQDHALLGFTEALNFLYITNQNGCTFSFDAGLSTGHAFCENSDNNDMSK